VPDVIGAVELTPELLEQLRQMLAPVFEEQREVWERERPAAIERFAVTGAVLESIGGNCPVQAEGTVDGQPFYFRARGDAWEFWVGAEADWFTDRAFVIERDYGTWPDAGWMPQHEALGFMVEAIAAYRAAVAEARRG
jgi:hypothetical protein